MFKKEDLFKLIKNISIIINNHSAAYISYIMEHLEEEFKSVQKL